MMIMPWSFTTSDESDSEDKPENPETYSELGDDEQGLPETPDDPAKLSHDAAELARRQSTMAGQEAEQDREQGDGITVDDAAQSTGNARVSRWIDRPPRPPRKSPNLLPSIHEAVKDIDIKLCKHQSSGLVGDDSVDTEEEVVVDEVKTLEELKQPMSTMSTEVLPCGMHWAPSMVQTSPT